MKMRRTINKRGSMLMMVMIMLIVAAIVAMKMMPDEQTQVTREKEAFYDSDLSQLREGIDLARLAAKDPSSPLVAKGWVDFCATDTVASISEKIAILNECGFLRKSDLKDNSVPDHMWGTSSSQIYWGVSVNYASNTSFELVSEDWAIAWEKETNASASMVENLRLNSMAIDEYPYQNKLGDSTRGENSIRMIKIVKDPTVTP